MVGSFVRGAQSINCKILKAVQRKGYHKESSPHGSRSSYHLHGDGEDASTTRWVPDSRTGIYYPQGHEKVIEDIPVGAAKKVEKAQWLSYTANAQLSNRKCSIDDA
ncbi:hypothetical protein C5167_048104 [Papaver somniferum]|uniref:Uncharacterized protein n=1 Tax=Papaver somniferum TaxID=3469 RepID=A0A4Y7KJV7_PAPSO|nr:uncharacterized protein LOC113304273 [Papaver somniferum]RZC72620.1 hypothetical protein C5167_048104 [Papaver somniferum]